MKLLSKISKIIFIASIASLIIIFLLCMILVLFKIKKAPDFLINWSIIALSGILFRPLIYILINTSFKYLFETIYNWINED